MKSKSAGNPSRPTHFEVIPVAAIAGLPGVKASSDAARSADIPAKTKPKPKPKFRAGPKSRKP